MTAIKGHFDGKVFVPDEPVDLPANQRVIMHLEVERAAAETQAGRPRKQSLLEWLGDNPVDDSALPTDLAHQHDHYLYGTPKKERRP